MLPQEELIQRVREVCLADDAVVAAMMYGSFAQSQGDRFSDVEFMLFFDDAALGALDPARWLAQVAPVEAYFVNEFGVGTAIFANLVRGEFHFERASQIAELIHPGIRRTDWFSSLEATLVKDSAGELAARLRPLIGPPPSRGSPEEVAFHCHSLINWLLFGCNVLARGELARALDILSAIHRHLLFSARLAEASTEHWPTPSRCLEQDISPAAYARFAACTARLERADLARAYRAAWAWGCELMRALAPRYGVALPEALMAKVEARLLEAL